MTGPGSKVEGKPKVFLEGTGLNYKIKLTKNDQKLKPNEKYDYAAVAPFPIEKVDSISVEWSRDGFGFSKLPVDSVIIDPSYISDLK